MLAVAARAGLALGHDAAVVLVLTRRRPADDHGQLSDADRERVSEAVAGMRATADEEDRL